MAGPARPALCNGAPSPEAPPVRVTKGMGQGEFEVARKAKIISSRAYTTSLVRLLVDVLEEAICPVVPAAAVVRACDAATAVLAPPSRA